MRIGAFTLDSGMSLLTESFSGQLKVPRERSIEKMLESSGSCIIKDIKSGIWIAGKKYFLLVHSYLLETKVMQHGLSCLQICSLFVALSVTSVPVMVKKALIDSKMLGLISLCSYYICLLCRYNANTGR